MNANEVLAMYENLAGLTRQMSDAAKAGDWNEFANLNVEAKVEARSASSGMPALEGAQRLRKIDLLKQLMANDRAIRDVTEPFDGQLERALQAH
jgi:flagellar protein FliT